MIFTIKNNELTVLGKTLKELKENFKDIGRIREEKTLFGKNSILSLLFNNHGTNVNNNPELLSQFEMFKEKFNHSQLSTKALAEEMKNVDTSIVSYAQTCKNGELTTEGFISSLKGMTLSAKVSAAAVKALSVAGNMLAIWAAGQAISLIAKGLSSLVTTVEEATEALNEINSDISGVQEKIHSNNETIRSLDSIVDKEEILRLKEENDLLNIQLGYLKELEKQRQKDKIQAIKTQFQKDYGNKGYDEETVNKYKEAFQGDKPLSFSTNRAVRNRGKSRLKMDNSLPSLVAQYQIYNEKLEEASETNDGKAVNQYTKKLNQVREKLIAMRVEIQNTQTQLKELNTVSPEVDGRLSLIDNTLEKTISKAKRISYALNSSISPAEIEKNFSPEEMVYLLKTGFDENATLADLRQLLQNSQMEADQSPVTGTVLFTSEAGNQLIDSFQSRVSLLSQALSKISLGELSGNELIDLIQQFPELEGQTDNLAQAIQSLIDKDLQTLLNGLASDTPQDFTDLLASIAEEAKQASGSVLTIPEALQAVESSSQAMADLKNNIKENGGITADMAVTLMNHYPQMTEILTDYLAGLASQADVILALQSIYSTDLKNYSILCLGKRIYDTDFYNSVLSNLPSWVEKMASAYGVDFENYKSVAEAKAAIHNSFFTSSQKASNNADYYQKLAESATSSEDAERYKKLAEKEKQKAKKYKKDSETLLNNMDEVAIDISGINKPTMQTISSSPTITIPKSIPSQKETKKTVDWVERKLELLARKFDVLQKKASSLYSTFKRQNKAITSGIKNIHKQIDAQKKAQKTYEKLASQVKLSEKLKKKVREGADIVGQVSGDDKEKIDLYKKYYDAAKAAASAVTDLIIKEKELISLKFDNIADDYNRKSSLQEAQNKLVEAKAGGNLKEKDYNAMIKNLNHSKTRRQEEYIKLKKLFDEQLENDKKLKDSDEKYKYSDRWYEDMEKLIEVQIAIEDCNKEIKEFAQSIMELRWKKFDQGMEKLNRFQDIVKELEGFFQEELFQDSGLTKNGLASVTLAFQGIAGARQEIENYRAAIADLEKQKKNKAITQEFYDEKRNSLENGQRQASLQIKAYRDKIIDLYIQSLESETAAMRELIQSKKDALQAEKELETYRDSIAKKQKNLSILEKKIAELSRSTDRKDIALRLQLEKELADAREDLAREQKDHSYELSQDGLNKELEDFEKAQEEKKKEVQTSLSTQEQILNDYLKKAQSNYSSTLDYIRQYAGIFCYDFTNYLSSPWEQALLKAMDYKSFTESITADTKLSLKNTPVNQKQTDIKKANKKPSGSQDKKPVLQPWKGKPETSKNKKKGSSTGTGELIPRAFSTIQEKPIPSLENSSFDSLLNPLGSGGHTPKIPDFPVSGTPFVIEHMDNSVHLSGLTRDEIKGEITKQVGSIPNSLMRTLRMNGVGVRGSHKL